MDQITIDVSDARDVRQGDTAVFIGKNGDAEISVFEIAEQAGTIPNEILSRLGVRLGRCAVYGVLM
jgi:serine/alanine racemase